MEAGITEAPEARPQPSEEELANTRAYIENTRIMNEVVREMKLIPELPSEKPIDIHPLLRVELPNNGGVYTYMEGYDEPYRGFPYYEFVDKIDTLKKILRGGLSSMYHSLKARHKLALLPLALTPWIFNSILRGSLQSSHRIINRFLIKPIRYSEPVREIHRAMSVNFHGETTAEREVRHQIRDVACMLLENDNAYRFRFQDILPKLDKVALVKRPSRELVRLLTLMQGREVTQEIKDTWTLAKTFLPAYFLLNRKVRRAVVATLIELDLDKIELSKEDKFFCKPRKDYSFGFINKENVST